MIELEKKWLLKDMPDFGSNGYNIATIQEFTQTYLQKNERLRKITDLLVPEKELDYQHHIKEKIGKGKSIETHRDLNEEEYDELRRKGIRELQKARITFTAGEGEVTYEIDEIHLSDAVRILMMEAEFQDFYDDMDGVDEYFRLPEFIQEHVLADVTGQDTCSNWNLAGPMGVIMSEEDIKLLFEGNNDGEETY